MNIPTMATLTTLLATLLVAPAPQPPGGSAHDGSGAAALAAALAHGQQTMAALEATDACS